MRETKKLSKREFVEREREIMESMPRPHCSN